MAKGTVSWKVRRYVAGRTDITPKAQKHYAWAILHVGSQDRRSARAAAR